MLRAWRRRAGQMRDSLLYGRENRRLADEAAAMQAGWIQAATDALPPLPDCGAVTVEVHTLCGTGQVLMGIWSSYSLMCFVPGARLVVHDDGTLTRADLARWQRPVPRLRVIGREEGRAAVKAHLARFPHARDWSLAHSLGLKPGAVMRHYVGTPRVRPRFFADGIPAVIRSARALGHVPADFAADAVPG
jgi:hypothetical protein